MLEAAAPKPFQALLVGQLPAIASLPDPETELELRRISADRAPEAIRQAAADVVVLDGGLSDRDLEPVLSAVEALEETVRPSLVVVTATERRSSFDRRRGWRRPPNAVLDGRRGGGEVVAGIQAVVQARRLTAELARREALVGDLQRRLDALSTQMAEELRLASRMQRSLLPPAVEHPRLDVAREFLPFREIGGDYYDFLPLGPHRLAFAIGDVMGKGIAAALLAASLKAAVRAQLQGGVVPPPADVVARVNRLFGEVAPRGIFASLFFAIFDLETLDVEYVNAGHDYPFVVAADGRVADLPEGGTLLGLVDGSTYEAGRVRLQRDDVVVFYSDGVTDRGDSDGNGFGAERLKEAARRSRGDAARIILYSMLGDVQGWSGGTPAQDDATLVVFKAR